MRVAFRWTHSRLLPPVPLPPDVMLSKISRFLPTGPALSVDFQPTSSGTTDLSGGANQVRVRAYNERLVLSLVRRHKGLSKAEIARRSGLSAQTVSVIMRSLESDGLLVRGALLRGKVKPDAEPFDIEAFRAQSYDPALRD